MKRTHFLLFLALRLAFVWHRNKHIQSSLGIMTFSKHSWRQPNPALACAPRVNDGSSRAGRTEMTSRRFTPGFSTSWDWRGLQYREIWPPICKILFSCPDSRYEKGLSFAFSAEIPSKSGLITAHAQDWYSESSSIPVARQTLNQTPNTSHKTLFQSS